MKTILSTICVVAVLGASLFADSVKEKTTAAGKLYGTTASQKLAFHGATPVAQRSNSSQTALTDSTGGDVTSATLAAITAGSSYSQADLVAVKNALAREAKLLNELRAALVEKGLIKGSQ